MHITESTTNANNVVVDGQTESVLQETHPVLKELETMNSNMSWAN